jgi:hypothetical protein
MNFVVWAAENCIVFVGAIRYRSWNAEVSGEVNYHVSEAGNHLAPSWGKEIEVVEQVNLVSAAPFEQEVDLHSSPSVVSPVVTVKSTEFSLCHVPSLSHPPNPNNCANCRCHSPYSSPNNSRSDSNNCSANSTVNSQSQHHFPPH